MINRTGFVSRFLIRPVVCGPFMFTDTHLSPLWLEHARKELIKNQRDFGVIVHKLSFTWQRYGSAVPVNWVISHICLPSFGSISSSFHAFNHLTLPTNPLISTFLLFLPLISRIHVQLTNQGNFPASQVFGPLGANRESN